MPDAQHLPSSVSRPVHVERSAARYVVQGTRLRLEFEFHDDRWGHRLQLLHAGVPIPVLTSLEGSAEDAAPASPAFQDLRLESFGDSVYEFQLMGQSGAAVYSAAIRFDGEQEVIEFDVCARFRKPGGSIQAVSTYEIASDWTAGPIADEGFTLRNRALHDDSPAIRIQLQEIPNPPSRAGFAPKISLDDTITVGWPDLPAENRGPGPLSLRWRYRIALISPG